MSDKERKNKKTAMEAASGYLASRMRTCSEVRKYLEDREYTAQETDDAVSELVSLGYLDDYDYALRYYEYNREKKRGRLRAERELAERGVDRETIRNAYEDFQYENSVNEYEDALSVAKREVFETADDGSGDIIQKEIDEKLIAKIGRKLENRGFRSDDIYRVMSEVRTWKKEI